MTPYGCKWVRMGVVGCRDTGEQENKGERGTNSRSGQYLVIHDHCKKNEEIRRDDLSDQRGQRGGMSSKLGVHRSAMVMQQKYYNTQLPNNIKKKAKRASAN